MKVKFYLVHAMEMELILIDKYASLICFYATVMSKRLRFFKSFNSNPMLNVLNMIE